jgi:two-component system phosphate regulon sensor histidine kinase PhoR
MLNFLLFYIIIKQKLPLFVSVLNTFFKTMRKSTIWLLVGVMGFTFTGLIFLQMSYVSTILKTTNEQFDATIKRCLEQVSHFIELDETSNYLKDSLLFNFDHFRYRNASDKQTISQSITTVTRSSTYQFQTQNMTGSIQKIEMSQFGGNNLRNEQSKDAIILGSEEQQKNLQRRLQYQAGLIHEVLYDLVYAANLKPVEERIDFNILDDYINVELASNGLDIPYIFLVVNKDGKTVYQNKVFDKPPKTVDMVTQVLFPKDPPSQRNYLKIFFPTKKDYLSSSVSFFVPSVLFSFILLLTFAFTIYSIFRQKKLSEMKNDFVNNMTHELKTPVSTISLAAQMLKDTSITKSSDVYQHISGVINDET